MGKVSMIVCTIVALLMLFLIIIINNHRSDSEHNHKFSVTKKTVRTFPEPGHSEWFKSHSKSTQLNLRQALKKNADGGDSVDDDMRLPVEEPFNASDADGDDLSNLGELYEESNMDRDGKTSFKDFRDKHCDPEDAPVIEKLYDSHSPCSYDSYRSIYNDDED